MTSFRPVAALAICVALISQSVEASGFIAVRIAAGPPDSGGYALAARLQQRVNANSADHRVMMAAEATRGAGDDLHRLHAARVDLLMIQDDVLAAGAPTTAGLVPIATVATAHVAIVARAAKGAVRAGDLNGLSVDLGGEDEGVRHTAQRIIAAAGATPRRGGQPAVGQIARIAAFCAGAVDAIAVIVMPGDNAIARLLDRCGGRFVDLGDIRARLPAYRFGTLPSGADGRAGATTPTVRMLLAGNGSASRAAAALARAGVL